MVHILATYLPAAVGVIAAIMILAPLSPRGEVSFLLDRSKVAITRERLRVDQATYRGLDNRDRPFSVTAHSAVQRSSRDPIVEMDQLVARLALEEGPAQITANDGIYDFDKEQVRVKGSVDVQAPKGYRLLTRNVTIDLDQRRVLGAGGVDGTIPAGTFRAEQIIADLGDRTVTLAGNARLRMEPGKLRLPQ